ncbi:KxYKxGKxW signal peptide domain-containing protein [Weissella cibaria]|uniref:KxYKxGKxW signal peptide domain-containing protein n=1 Tax=Weissella cibaria TaxID=137591 RepID=UPI001CD32C7A|nr:KxYKxGKxW signal peptide domain-containing protein [Weissella cibaria]MCA1355827.1 KxYKxGKxW signal peptide domain-containing protein [Weissella cibaria]MDQ2124833.1 KxYKxGKxW signal peptide domain-containing protein [Weissella cibaria]MDQ2158362.1 KxYKxGKxW signal peptide domain-containing protein [Weissella cibaria]
MERAQGHGEGTTRFKMYKDGKRWVTRGLTVAGVALVVGAPVATATMQLASVSTTYAQTVTSRQLTATETDQISRLQSVMDSYSFVRSIALDGLNWQDDLTAAYNNATQMIQTIQSGEFTHANGVQTEGTTFSDQQVTNAVNRVEDYALAIEVADIRAHHAGWYAEVVNGQKFSDIHYDVLTSYAPGAQDGFVWMKPLLLEIINGNRAETNNQTNVVTSSAVDSALSVQESSAVDSSLSVQESSAVGSALSVQESSAVDSALSVQESSAVDSALSVQESSAVGSALSVQESSAVGSALSVQESSAVGSALSVQESSAVDSALSVQESSAVGSALSVQESSAVGDPVVSAGVSGKSSTISSASNASAGSSSLVEGPTSSATSSTTTTADVERSANASHRVTTSNNTSFANHGQVGDDVSASTHLMTSQSVAPVLSAKAVALDTLPTVMASDAGQTTRQVATIPSSSVMVSSGTTAVVSSATSSTTVSATSSAASSSVVSATSSSATTQNVASNNGGTPASTTAPNVAGNNAPAAAPVKNAAVDDGATVQAGVNTAGNDATSHLNDTQFSLNDNTQVLGTILSTIIAIASGIAFKIVRSRKGAHASENGEFDEEDEQLFDMVAKLKNFIK